MSYYNPKHHPDTGLSQPWLTKPGNETLTEGLSVGKEQSWPSGPVLARGLPGKAVSSGRLCAGTWRVRKSEPQEARPRRVHLQPESTADYSLGPMAQVEFSPLLEGEFTLNSVA